MTTNDNLRIRVDHIPPEKILGGSPIAEVIRRVLGKSDQAGTTRGFNNRV